MFDPSILLGAQSVRVPDPLDQYTKALTLGGLMDQTEIRRMAVEQAKRQNSAQDALSRVLPSVMQAGFSPESMQAAVQQSPEAGGALLKMLDERRKAEADYGKATAAADKDRAEAQVALLKPIANQAYTLAQRQNLDPQVVGSFMQSIAKLGLDKFVSGVKFQDWTNPDKMRENLAVLGNSFYEAEKQAGEARLMQKQPYEIAEIQARTGKEIAGTDKTRAEIPYVGMTELAARQNANTNAGRLSLERTNANRLQHITADGNVYTFDPVTGATNPARDAQGQPLVTAGKALTETQGNATAYGMRMRDASKTIRYLEQSGNVDPTGQVVAAAGNRGVVGSATNAIAGAINPLAQVYKQAQKNWVTANLRKESGAAIPPDEMEADINKWFPQIGDKDEVIESKRAAREVAERAMVIQAGPGSKNIPDPAPSGRNASGTIKAPAVPRLGEVRDGYLYKGGDPASQNSWERVGGG